MVEPPDGGVEGALGGERADVQLVDHRAEHACAAARPRQPPSVQSKAVVSKVRLGPCTPCGCQALRGSGSGSAPSRRTRSRRDAVSSALHSHATRRAGRHRVRRGRGRPSISLAPGLRGPDSRSGAPPHQQGHRPVGQQVRRGGRLRAVVDRLVVGEHVVPGAGGRGTCASAEAPGVASSPAARVATVTTRAPVVVTAREGQGVLAGGGQPAYVVPSPRTPRQVAAHPQRASGHPQLLVVEVRRPARPARTRSSRSPRSVQSTGRRLSGSTSESMTISQPW